MSAPPATAAPAAGTRAQPPPRCVERLDESADGQTDQHAQEGADHRERQRPEATGRLGVEPRIGRNLAVRQVGWAGQLLPVGVEGPSAQPARRQLAQGTCPVGRTGQGERALIVRAVGLPYEAEQPPGGGGPPVRRTQAGPVQGPTLPRTLQQDRLPHPEGHLRPGGQRLHPPHRGPARSSARAPQPHLDDPPRTGKGYGGPLLDGRLPHGPPLGHEQLLDQCGLVRSIGNLDEEADAPVEGMTRVLVHGGILPGGPEKTCPQVRTILPGDTRWGGWDSNPRPTDYESAALTG